MAEVLQLVVDTRRADRALDQFEARLSRIGEQARRMQRSLGRSGEVAKRAARDLSGTAQSADRLGRAMRDASDGTKQLERSADRAQRELRGIDRDARRARAGLRLLGRAIAVLGVGAGFAGLARLVSHIANVGAAAEEASSKFETVFGAASGGVSRFLDDFAQGAGLTRTAAEDFAGGLGNVVTALGFTRAEAADASEDILRLAGDLASFNNVPVERTINAIRSALTGEREALKSLGIVVREQDVDQQRLVEAQERGIDASSDLAAAYATMTLIAERAGAAVGDLERTSDSLANQKRQLAAQVGNLDRAFSQTFTPALTSIVTSLNEHFDTMVTLLGAAAGGLTALGAVAAGRALAGMVALRGGVAGLIALLGGPAGLAALATIVAGGAVAGGIAISLAAPDEPREPFDVDFSFREERGFRHLQGEGFEVMLENAETIRQLANDWERLGDLDVIPQDLIDRTQELYDIISRPPTVPPWIRGGEPPVLANLEEYYEYLRRVNLFTGFSQRLPDVPFLGDNQAQVSERLVRQQIALRDELQGLLTRANFAPRSRAALADLREEIETLPIEELESRLARVREQLSTQQIGTTQGQLTRQFLEESEDLLTAGIERRREAADAEARRRQQLAEAAFDNRQQVQQALLVENIIIGWEIEELPFDQIRERIADLDRRRDLLFRLPFTVERQEELLNIDDRRDILVRGAGQALAREFLGAIVEAPVPVPVELVPIPGRLQPITRRLYGGQARRGGLPLEGPDAERLIAGMANLAASFDRGSRAAARGRQIGGQAGSLAGELGLFGSAIGPGIGTLIGQSVGALLGTFLGSNAEHLQRLRQNTAALEKLTLGLVDTRTALGEVTGEQFNIITLAIDSLRELDPVPGSGLAFGALAIQLAGLGVTVDDVKNLAEQFGYELIGTVGSLEGFAELLRAAQLAVFQTPAGQLDLARIRAGLTDRDEDPAFVAQELSAIVGGELSGALARLFRAGDFAGIIDLLASGDFDFTELGGLSLNTFISVIQEIERLGDQAEDAANALGDAARVLNAPSGFKVALERFNATVGEADPIAGGGSATTGPVPSTSPGGGSQASSSEVTTYNFAPGSISIDSSLAPERLFDLMEEELERRRARGGRSAFDVPRSRA